MAKRSSSHSRVRASFKKSIQNQEIEELKRTVNFLDSYIVKYSEDLDLMACRLKETQENKGDFEIKLKTEKEYNKSLQDQINILKNEVNTLNIRIIMNEDVYTEKLRKEEAVKADLQKRLNQALEMLKMAAEEVNELRRHRTIFRQKLLSLFSYIQIPKKCLYELCDPEKPIKKCSKYFKNISKLYSENLRLHEENRQLYQKIESLPESSNFKDLIKDSNGLTFFKNKANCGKPTCSANEIYTSSWIPRPMHSALEEFTSKYDSVINTAVLSLFYKLNQTWQNRENNRIERLQKKHTIELTSLLKKIPSPERTPVYKKSRSHTRTSSVSRVRENITKEFKTVSDQVIKLVTEFIEVTERNFNVEKSPDWLIESLLRNFAEFTDKILTFF